ncbi:MAG: CPBP family intramembrane metalloprotease [Gammaproteobacteria bacterium]|nr:CPBP family intramembrane metalloprotease [Gammaproteobacteria bacterium]
MSRYTLLILNGALLTGCAVFIYDARTAVLTGLMLFLPFIDRHWHPPIRMRRAHQSPYGAHGAPYIWLALVVSAITLLVINPQHISTAVMILLLTALPEEWFFRAYFTTQLQKYFAGMHTRHSASAWLANIAASLLFALLHTPTQGWFGLSIFFPSLLFGWIYQQQKSLTLVIALHAMSNLVFIIYIKEFLQKISINF